MVIDFDDSIDKQRQANIGVEPVRYLIGVRQSIWEDDIGLKRWHIYNRTGFNIRLGEPECSNKRLVVRLIC